MRTLFLGALIALACVLPVHAATPAPVPSSSAPAPVISTAAGGGDLLKIDDCSLEYNDISGVPAKLHVDFENLNAKAVTHIRFRIRTSRTTFAVMDVGTFQPKLRIHHDLDPPEVNLHVISAVTGGAVHGLGCSVDAYTLTDGYTWVSPELQFELEHPGAQQSHLKR